MLDIAVRQDDLVVFSLWGRLFGQETRTEYAYLQTWNEDIPLLTGYCGFFEDQKMPAIQGMSTPDILYYNIRADVWEPVVDGYSSVGFRDYPLNLQGTVGTSGAALPPNNALVMRRRTGIAGRANRGRVYLPAVPTAWQTGGVLAGSGFIDASNNFTSVMGVALKDASDPTPLAIADISLVRRAALGNPTVVQKVQYWDVNNVVRSQRRREYGVGI